MSVCVRKGLTVSFDVLEEFGLQLWEENIVIAMRRYIKHVMLLVGVSACWRSSAATGDQRFCSRAAMNACLTQDW